MRCANMIGGGSTTKAFSNEIFEAAGLNVEEDLHNGNREYPGGVETSGYGHV